MKRQGLALPFQSVQSIQNTQVNGKAKVLLAVWNQCNIGSYNVVYTRSIQEVMPSAWHASKHRCGMMHQKQCANRRAQQVQENGQIWCWRVVSQRFWQRSMSSSMPTCRMPACDASSICVIGFKLQLIRGEWWKRLRSVDRWLEKGVVCITPSCRELSHAHPTRGGQSSHSECCYFHCPPEEVAGNTEKRGAWSHQRRNILVYLWIHIYWFVSCFRLVTTQLERKRRENFFCIFMY